MPRPKSAPTYCVHKRSQRAYTTIDGRQVQLGEANSPESRKAFDRILAAYYANGRKLPPESSKSAAPVRAGPTVAVLLEAFWRHCQVYYTQPVYGPDGPLTNEDGTPKVEPSDEQRHYRECIKLLNRHFADMQTADFGCPQLEALRDIVITPRSPKPRNMDCVPGGVRSVNVYSLAVANGQMSKERPGATAANSHHLNGSLFVRPVWASPLKRLGDPVAQLGEVLKR